MRQFINRRNVLIAVVVVCLLIIAVDWLLATSREAFIVFLGTLIATFAGVSVAAYINIQIFDAQERKRNEEREERLAQSLAAELVTVLDMVRAPAHVSVSDPNETGSTVGVVYAQLAPTAIEEAIKVGLLGQQHNETLSQNTANLSQLASFMREYTRAGENLRPLVIQWTRGDESAGAPAYRMAQEVDRLRQNLEIWCPGVINRLEQDGVVMPPDPWYRSDPSISQPYSG